MAFTRGDSVATTSVQASKVSGLAVTVDPLSFLEILSRTEKPVVIAAGSRWFSPGHKYVTQYGGFAFYTSSPVPLGLPADADVITSRWIAMPM